MSLAAGTTDVDLFTDVSERDMDFLFCEEIECNPVFASWLLKKSAANSVNGGIVRIARSLVEAEGESDLVIVHLQGDSRRATMIENKINAPFTKDQPERYLVRGKKGIPDEWEEFTTVLMAPNWYVEKAKAAAVEFQHTVAYEDVDKFFAAQEDSPRTRFKRRILAAAIAKTKTPYRRVLNDQVSGFFAEFEYLARREFPAIPIPTEVKGRPRTSTWTYIKPGKFPSGWVVIELKPGAGIVDLRFRRIDVTTLRAALGDHLESGMGTADAEASSSIQVRLAAMDVRAPLMGQENLARDFLRAVERLILFVSANRQTIDSLHARRFEPKRRG